ncbi:MAG: MerR family transcriptional regulator [Prevotella sp.]|nr:MerR family transcriptional regulator [Prevotella sp.]
MFLVGDELMEPEYSMDEVQQMTDLPATALRFWEEQFSGLDPRTDNEGNRYYTMDNINLIKQIKFFHYDLGINEISMIVCSMKK